MIPRLDIGCLYGGESRVRAEADRAIRAAAAEVGFIEVVGLPDFVPLSGRHFQRLMRIFSLPPGTLQPLWRQKFAPAHQNVYRGWFPLQDGHSTYKEGIDIGPDVAHGAQRVDRGDPLREATPLPAEALLAGWRDAVAAYYVSMELTGRVLMRALARGLGVRELIFDPYFESGISTLRLIRYPPRASVEPLSGAPHVDSGVMTLLAQDEVGGLQARNRNGSWIDIRGSGEALVVNFGRLLELWTGGGIRATEHRVAGVERERFSMPFFYEPRVDAVIAPLPGLQPPPVGAAAFSPFLYGDFVWASATQFVEFSGLQDRRPPRGGDLPIFRG